MRKFIFVLFALSFSLISSHAADKTMSVVVQLLPDQKDQLPEKTLAMKVPVLQFSMENEITEAVASLMDSVAENDFTNRYFLISIQRNSDNTIIVEVVDHDPFDTQGRQYSGLMLNGYQAFLLRPESAPFLPLKKKGKVKLERVYEFVEEPMPPQSSRYSVTISR